MNDIPSYLRRAAEQSGFHRSRYNEANLPALPEDICVMAFFGDMRSAFILSSLLLKRYREQIKGSKYFILCSWPGYEGLFPYVDEYWAIKKEENLDRFYLGSSGFHNTSTQELFHRRRLNWFFEDVVDFSAMEPYYNNGITQEFWERFKHIKRTLPSVPSVGIMGPGVIQQLKKIKGDQAVIYPVRYVQHWRHGSLVRLSSDVKFWLKLAESMLENNITPIVFQDFLTHDLSTKLTSECVFIDEKDILKLLGVMRHVGCVVDICSGISRLAVAARAPFVACDERARYVALKEYEIDGLCCEKALPREYIFTFSTIINRGTEGLWDINFFDNVVVKLKNLLKDIDRDSLPSTSECTTIVPYENVRKRKMLRLGTKFIKVPKD